MFVCHNFPMFTKRVSFTYSPDRCCHFNPVLAFQCKYINCQLFNVTVFFCLLQQHNLINNHLILFFQEITIGQSAHRVTMVGMAVFC